MALVLLENVTMKACHLQYQNYFFLCSILSMWPFLPKKHGYSSDPLNPMNPVNLDQAPFLPNQLHCWSNLLRDWNNKVTNVITGLERKFWIHQRVNFEEGHDFLKSLIISLFYSSLAFIRFLFSLIKVSQKCRYCHVRLVLKSQIFSIPCVQ